MILHKPFMITYFSTKDGCTITRRGTWTDKCKYFTSKIGNNMMTYFDRDKQGYRTAKQTRLERGHLSIMATATSVL